MNKTWFIDIDGTIFKQRNNAELDISQNSGLAGTDEDGEELLPSVADFFETIPETDQIVLTTARHTEHRVLTEKALSRFGLLERVDTIVYDITSGPRILINDVEDDTEQKAYAINVKRDEGLRQLIDDDGLC